MRHLFPLAILLAVHATARAEDASAAFQKRVLPILQAHCTECHGGDKPKGKLDLAGPRSLDQLRSSSHPWFSVLERVEAGTMPPAKSEPLKPADKQALAAWVRGELTELLIEQQRQVGRSKLRRLSRNEYANTVQDIFGIRPPVVRLMPSDGRVDGYDKVSAALPFSTAATEGQLKIAEDLVARMFELPRNKVSYRLWSRGSEQSKGHVLNCRTAGMCRSTPTRPPVRSGKVTTARLRAAFPAAEAGPASPADPRLWLSNRQAASVGSRDTSCLPADPQPGKVIEIRVAAIHHRDGVYLRRPRQRRPQRGRHPADSAGSRRPGAEEHAGVRAGQGKPGLR